MISIEMLSNACRVGSEKYPRVNPRQLQYGTAGFREKANELPHVLYRMGLLAAIRASVKRATIGVMVTASHNPVADNGVKLVDPHGEMLEQKWEEIATQLANASDDDLENCLTSIVKSYQLDPKEPPFVFIGQDTRPSSASLAEAAKCGAEALGAKVKDFGVVSTPILHYVVASRNASGALGMPTEEGYFYRLSHPFITLRGEITQNGKYEAEIDYDGANGVGAIKMKELLSKLGNSLKVNVYNDGNGELNHLCGADYVKVQQQHPNGVPLTHCRRGVSVDGDADRIIYFYTDDEGVFHLLDGDKIATLVAGYLMELVTASKLDIQLGLVQTAYANGSSTSYIADCLKVPVACVATGVKHLHHRALQFDIGVYFEANGHGTVVFSDKAKEKLQNESLPEDERVAARKLSALGELINQTVGDAISDMLLVETILHARGWSIADWNASYTDLPNRQLKVTVKDRNVVTTTDAERKCVTPVGLQARIDVLVGQYSKGRAFVRPSGTEDVVRVYAEAATRIEADDLAKNVVKAAFDLAGGTGTPPVSTVCYCVNLLLATLLVPDPVFLPSKSGISFDVNL